MSNVDDPPANGAEFLIRLATDRKTPPSPVPARLFPHKNDEEDEKQAFQPFVRLSVGNPAELVARLTGVKRRQTRKAMRGLLPVSARQNDPSFEGRLCPFETPESELIGLSLHLARGARVDKSGTILSANRERPLDCLGWGTSLIPFSNFNDGARNMMGAKNLRQSTRIAGRRPPAVTTGAERELVERTAGLVRIGVVPDCTCDGKLALGRDLLVAYMPWKGWNVDDAVVVRRGIADEMAIEECKPFSWRVNPEWTCEVAPDRRKDGTVLRPGDTIATLRKRGDPNETPVAFKYEDPGEAVLVRTPKPFGCSEPEKRNVGGHVLEYEIRKTLPLGPGDKLMGRHGNKGVVGLVLDDSEMPRLPDDPRLPEPVRGKPVDILLNPHGVLSRMNPGQLLEAHVGWLLHAGVDERLLRRIGPDTAIGAPAAGSVNRVNHATIREKLEETGLDENGAIRLKFADGSRTLQPVVVGFEHFVRLHHVPLLKAQARRGGLRAAYSSATGQPVRGRMLGGGQRLGEMEVWALAAHGASSILREMLGVKSDASLAREWASSDKSALPVCGTDSGFAPILKDWLFALGFDLSVAPDKKSCSVSFLSEDDILSRIGRDRQVADASGPFTVVATRFAASDGSPFPGEFLVETGENTLSLADFLSEFGYCCPSTLDEIPMDSSGGGSRTYRMDLCDNASGTPAGYLEIRFSYRKESQKSMGAEIRLFAANGAPTTLNGMDRIFCRLDLRGSGAGEAVETMKQNIDGLLQKAKLCSPGNHSKLLKAVSHGLSFLKGKPNSLYDEILFGNLRTGDGGWGYLKLPRAVHFPSKRPSGEPGEFEPGPKTSVIPVLPLRYRLPKRDSPEGDDIHHLNGEYKDVLNSENATLQEAVDKLYEKTKKLFEGKSGLLRRDGLGRRVDRSFRLVITPDPDLDWDECGIPASILWEVLGDLVEREKGLISTDTGSVTKSVTKRGGMSWHNDRRPPCEGENLSALLNAFLDRHPDFLVILNRQPSLHRDSIQAFKPVATNPDDGEVLRISPLCCKGFGADFDGDEMVGHVPVSFAARTEASHLLPEHNLIFAASGKPTPNYDRDLVTGLQLIHDTLCGIRENLDRYRLSLQEELDRLELPECCLAILHDHNFKPGECGKELVRHLCSGSPCCQCETLDPAARVHKLSLLARLAWKTCTETGFSFGFYDLVEIAGRIGTNVSAVDDETVKKVLDDVFLQNKVPHAAGAHNIATMVCSEANGHKQIGQLVAKRGKLSGCGERRSFDSTLIGGMSWKDSFDASWNARLTLCDKKLGTAKGGGLTRKLVLALWPLAIVEDDCGSDEAARTPLTCRSFERKTGFCRACCEAVSKNRAMPIGCPVGLVAAQSIGERGTQLSMKSFQTGRLAATGVKGLDSFLKKTSGENYPQFYKIVAGRPSVLENTESEGGNEYAELDEIHFMVLWRAWHEGLFESPTPWAELLKGSQQLQFLSNLAKTGQALSLDSPMAKVVFGLV